eukprot:Gb_14059 [translate_table: standard]
MAGGGQFENMPCHALSSKLVAGRSLVHLVAYPHISSTPSPRCLIVASDVGRRLILATPLFVLFPSCGCNGTFGMRCVPGGGLFENMARFTPRFRRVVALSLLLPFPCSIVNWLLLDGVDGSREGCAGGAGHPSGCKGSRTGYSSQGPVNRKPAEAFSDRGVHARFLACSSRILSVVTWLSLDGVDGSREGCAGGAGHPSGRLILANPLFVLFPSCGCNGTFGMRCVPGGGLFENMARFTPRFRRVVALSLLLPFPCSIVNWLLLDGVDGSREGCAGGAGHPSGVSYGILLPGACEPKAGIVLLRLVFAHPPPPPTHEYVPAPYAILLPRRPVNPNARSPRSFSPSDHLPRQVRSSLKCYNAVWSGSPWLSPLLHNVARGMRPSLNHLYRPPACLPPASPPLSLFSRLDPNAIAYVQENMISPFCSTHLFIPVAALPLDPAERDDFVESDAKRCPPNQFDGRLVSCCTASGAPDGSADVAFRTPPAPCEKSKFLGSGGSMVARLKLKGIDGRAPPGVEPAA